jgi:non-ribosomal peptide synthetase component F
MSSTYEERMRERLNRATPRPWRASLNGITSSHRLDYVFSYAALHTPDTLAVVAVMNTALNAIEVIARARELLKHLTEATEIVMPTLTDSMQVGARMANLNLALMALDAAVVLPPG